MAVTGPPGGGMPGLGRVDVRRIVEGVHQPGGLDRTRAALY
jgi:hypothetical protein